MCSAVLLKRVVRSAGRNGEGELGKKRNLASVSPRWLSLKLNLEVLVLAGTVQSYSRGKANRTKHTELSPRQLYIAVSESRNQLFRNVSAA